MIYFLKKIFVSRDEDAPDHALFTASKNRWKKMRSIMNPTFSSTKLREIGPLLILCSDRLKKVLENETEKEVNITQYFEKLIFK